MELPDCIRRFRRPLRGQLQRFVMTPPHTKRTNWFARISARNRRPSHGRRGRASQVGSTLFSLSQLPAVPTHASTRHLLSSLDLQELLRRDDLDLPALLQVQQMAIPGDQVVGLCRYCTIQHQVIRWIFRDQFMVFLGRYPLSNRGQLCDGVVNELKAQSELWPLRTACSS